MKKLLGLITAFVFMTNTNAQVFDVDTIVYNGSTSKYINYVILGDGYDSSELGKFHDDVVAIKEEFFHKSPFSNYKNYFNLFAINVISPESGIKHPRTSSDCPPVDKLPFSNPKNYFGTAFDNGVHRAIYPNYYMYNRIGNVLMDNVPEYDQAIILGNSSEYGGAGGDFACLSTHPLSVEIMLHECGHSFAGLADEYWAGSQFAKEKPNLTAWQNATKDEVKWKDWLGIDGIGIFKHEATGVGSEWYKPHTNCEMQYLEREFCRVCTQTIIERIQSLVDPIESYEPQNAKLNNIDSNSIFKITSLIKPEPNTLKIEWELDGYLIAEDTVDITLDAETMAGEHTLTLTVTDTTELVKLQYFYTEHISKVTWLINGGRNMGVENMSYRIAYKIYPNPASESIFIESSDVQSADVQEVSIMDISGKTVFQEKYKSSNADFLYSIPVRNFAEGIYIVNIKTNNGVDKLRISVIH